MITMFEESSSLTHTAGVVGLLALVWLGFGTIQTDTTLHLGPVLLPLTAGLLAPKRNAVGAVLLSGGVALAVIVVLSISGNLAGPAIRPFTSAATESLVLLGIGTVAGIFLARTAR